MIYTVTMNPSLDYVMMFKEVELGELNRSSREMHLIGGKGINVSIVLNNLGVESTCLGFVAGYVGNQIEAGLSYQGCRTDFIHIKNGCTRINVKVKEIFGRESELNGNGPQIMPEDVEQLKNSIRKMQKGDILILSGSIPKGVDEDIYGQLAAEAHARGLQIVADAERKYLFPVLPYQPLLIKPNLVELQVMLGKEIRCREELQAGVHALRDKGARNILVSMGKDGAYFLGESGEEYVLEAPRGTVVNTVGSGDSMIAGFLSRYILGADTEECVRYAVASGSAGAFSEQLPQKWHIENLVEKVGVERLSGKARETKKLIV